MQITPLTIAQSYSKLNPKQSKNSKPLKTTADTYGDGKLYLDIHDFQNTKNGVLFASGSTWEGVDCAGDCLSSVIIVRLPFPRRSIQMQRKKEQCDSHREFIDNHCVPSMIIKLRQGVGRLIRTETDTGVVSILDPRANHAGYNKAITTALRKYPIVQSVDDIEQFIRSTKKSEYYE